MELIERIPFLNKILDPFRQNIYLLIGNKFPRAHFVYSILIATVGFLFLLLFPYLVISFFTYFFNTLVNANNFIDGLIALGYLIASILCGVISWSLLQQNYSFPTGLELKADKSPIIHKLVSELSEHFGNSKIHRIIIRDNFDIQIIKTPHYLLPIFTTNTLVIGLPVLLTTSPAYFRTYLSRRIGQLSSKHTPITSRLFYLNDVWKQYRDTCIASQNIIVKLYGYFFKAYCIVYDKTLIHLFKEEELEADRYALDLVNDLDMVECVIYVETLTQYLTKKYWPTINQMAKRGGNTIIYPFAQMSKVVRNGITNKEIVNAVQFAVNVDESDHLPSLKRRLHNMGYDKPEAPKRLGKTAADLLLPNSQKQIVELFDKIWLKKNRR